jgi:hypothetical protein
MCSFICLFICRLWDHATMTEVKSLNFNMSVSSMEYIPEGEILVITYGRSIAFHSAVRYVCPGHFFIYFCWKETLKIRGWRAGSAVD